MPKATHTLSTVHALRFAACCGLFCTVAGATRPEPELVRPRAVARPEPELVQPRKKPRLEPELVDPRKSSVSRSSPVAPVRALTPELRQQIRDAAVRAALDPALVEAVVRTESNGKETARSHKGAMGLMQVIPGTADENGIHDPYNTASNLMGACDYLRKLINRYRGDVELALAAYNAGPTAVQRYGGIPPYRETQNYVRKVMRLYRENTAQRRSERTARR